MVYCLHLFIFLDSYLSSPHRHPRFIHGFILGESWSISFVINCSCVGIEIFAESNSSPCSQESEYMIFNNRGSLYQAQCIIKQNKVPDHANNT